MLRPDGCLVVGFWQSLEANPAYAALLAIARTNREPEEASGQP